MQVLVGVLLIAVLLDLLGSSESAWNAGSAIARRLTVVMTYVINLGVPPLLFAHQQRDDRRALDRVVPALVLAYWLLYRFSTGVDAGKESLVEGHH